MARDDERQRAALRERGRQRLMLRMPAYRRALADATGESFLDLCEGYELAWAGLDHWSHTAVEVVEQYSDYQELIVALEAEVINLISRG